MKESFYFSHDSNARSDEKMIKLRSRHGAMGYGIFFMLIEMLREAKDYQMLLDYEAIAYEIREDKKVIEDVIQNFSLLEKNEKYFWSDSLKDRMREREKIRKKRQEAGKKGGLAKATVLLKQKPSKVLAGKERKGKEIKGKEKKENTKKLGEFKNVCLSEKELKLLEERFGKDDMNKRIESLSSYIASKGKKYKSHYATILVWAKGQVNTAGKSGLIDPKDIDTTKIDL